MENKTKQFNTHVYQVPLLKLRSAIEQNVIPLCFHQLRKESNCNLPDEMVESDPYKIEKITIKFGKAENGDATFQACMDYEILQTYTDEECKAIYDEKMTTK